MVVDKEVMMMIVMNTNYSAADDDGDGEDNSDVTDDDDDAGDAGVPASVQKSHARSEERAQRGSIYWNQCYGDHHHHHQFTI